MNRLGLMATSSKRIYATSCVTRYLCPEPLPLQQATADSYLHRRLKHRSGSISVGSLGPGVHTVLFESSEQVCKFQPKKGANHEATRGLLLAQIQRIEQWLPEGKGWGGDSEEVRPGPTLRHREGGQAYRRCTPGSRCKCVCVCVPACAQRRQEAG